MTTLLLYAGWLKEYASKYKVAIHAWVFMTNHVHLLCTPSTAQGVLTMMQTLGRMYVLYFNRTYRRTGTLWEGRFKSSLVQEEAYLLELHRYIELNPIRAGMVDDPAEYPWSSCQCNALGNEQFKDEIECLTGIAQRTKKRGRPEGWRKNDKSDLNDKTHVEIPK